VSKGIQAKGKFVLWQVKGLLDIWGQTPVEYVARRIQLFKAMAALEPERLAFEESAPPVPSNWFTRKLTANEWDGAKRDVTHACKHLGSHRYSINLGYPYDMISFIDSGELLLKPKLGWKAEIDKEKEAVEEFLRRHRVSQ